MATGAELLDAIKANPDELKGYLVYGDWLTSQGDPRGELIALHREGLTEQAEAYIAEHRADLLGEALASFDPSLFQFQWRLGFLRRVTVILELGYEFLHPGDEVALVQAIVGSPSASVLHTLHFGVPSGGVTYGRIAHQLAQTPVPDLRALLLRPSEHGGDLSITLYPSIGNVRGLLNQLPRLQHLSLWGPELGLGRHRLHAPDLHTLDLNPFPGSLGDTVIRTVAVTPFASLRSLALRFGFVWDGDHPIRTRRAEDMPWPTLQLLLRGENLPELTELTLELASLENTHRFMPHLLESDLIRRLKVLRLLNLDMDARHYADDAGRQYPDLRVELDSAAPPTL